MWPGEWFSRAGQPQPRQRQDGSPQNRVPQDGIAPDREACRHRKILVRSGKTGLCESGIRVIEAYHATGWQQGSSLGLPQEFAAEFFWRSRNSGRETTPEVAEKSAGEDTNRLERIGKFLDVFSD